jgi:hypothetical protein
VEKVWEGRNVLITVAAGSMVTYRGDIFYSRLRRGRRVGRPPGGKVRGIIRDVFPGLSRPGLSCFARDGAGKVKERANPRTEGKFAVLERCLRETSSVPKFPLSICGRLALICEQYSSLVRQIRIA